MVSIGGFGSTRKFLREWHNYLFNVPWVLVWVSGLLHPEEPRGWLFVDGLVCGVYIGLGIYGIARRIQRKHDRIRERLDRASWEIDTELRLAAKYTQATVPKTTPNRTGGTLHEY